MKSSTLNNIEGKPMETPLMENYFQMIEKCKMVSEYCEKYLQGMASRSSGDVELFI